MRNVVAALAVALGALCLSACVAPGPAIYMEGQHADLQRRLAGTGVEVLRQADDIAVRMPNDIVFAVDRADIAPAFDPVLDNLAESINHYPQTRVEVIGHADSTGSDAYNQILSEKRAASVAEYLINRGVTTGRLSAAGRGEGAPIASNATVGGRARNRRVEVILHPLEPARPPLPPL